MNKTWKNTTTSQYFYDEDTGLIVGQVHGVVHTEIWLAKIIYNHNNEKYLGQFISMEHAKRAVEQFWEVESKTFLEIKNNYTESANF